MDIGLAVGLIGLLLVLFLGYNVIIQHRERELAQKKHEVTKQKTIIKTTEELIDFARVIPFNQKLFLCLHGRILDAVQQILIIDPKNKEFKGNDIGRKKLIKQIQSQEDFKDSCQFRTPKNDKQAIAMLKIIKRLKDIVRSEHNKGRMPTLHYTEEMDRLELLQMKINIENASHRAKEAISMGQYGTALQLLRKSVQTLQTKTDEYCVSARDKMEQLIDKLEAKQQKRSKEELEAKQERERDEMDEIFGEKKKW